MTSAPEPAAVHTELIAAPRGRLATFARTPFGRLLRLRLPVFGLVVVVVVAFGAVFANLLAPYSPELLQTRGPQPPSGTHWLGTDQIGRDILSRLLFGARASLQVAFVATALGTAVGIVLGLVAAGARGITDSVITRTLDAQMALPGLVLPLLLLSVVGGGVHTVSIALGITLIPTIARLVRGQALSELGRDYVLAARATGATESRVLSLHVLPNSLPPVIVAASLAMSTAVIAEAGLSFLGVGVTPPTSTWGTMLSAGFSYLRTSPWIAIVPGMAIFLLVLAFNFLGDGLRDVLDPRLRGKI